MLVEKQCVSVRWNQSNYKWYINKGYIFREFGDIFEAGASDLMPESKHKVDVVCDYCGELYETSFCVYMRGHNITGKDCCKKCSYKKRNEVRRIKVAPKKIGMAKSICETKGYKLLTAEEDYTGVKMDVKFVCPAHGEQTIMLDNLLHGHGCRRCAYESVGKTLAHDKEYVIAKIEEISGNTLLNPDDYSGALTRNLKIQCSCGRVFTTSFSNYTRAQKNRCSVCANKDSFAEKAIGDYLRRNSIQFTPEKRFADCRDKKPLPFDFYIPDRNLIIEYDGTQHYLPVRGEKQLQITQKHDKMKDEYCASKNIDILRIPYWETKRMFEIIDNKLSA